MNTIKLTLLAAAIAAMRKAVLDHVKSVASK